MTLAKYKELVSEYTNTSNHQTKELFRQTIEGIKRAFKTLQNLRHSHLRKTQVQLQTQRTELPFELEGGGKP